MKKENGWCRGLRGTKCGQITSRFCPGGWVASDAFMRTYLADIPSIIRAFGFAAVAALFAALPARAELALHDGEVSDAFLPVAERIDLGGLVYLFADLEEDVLTIARKIEPMLGLAQETFSPIPPIPISAEAIVREANLNGLRAFGLSSVRHQGLYRNSTFLYLPQGRNGLFSFFGGDRRPFAGLPYTPADASYFFEIEYDVPALIEAVKNVSGAVMGDAGPNMIEAALQEPMEPGYETTYRDLVDVLRGRLSASVSLDRDARISLPDTNTTIPDIEFLVRFENVAPILNMFIRDNPVFEAVSLDGSPGYRVREPIDPEVMDKHIVFLIEAGDVFIASSEAHLDRVLGLRDDHLGNDASFLDTVNALGGSEGNQIEFMRPDIYEELFQVIESLDHEEETALLMSFLSFLLPRADRPTASIRYNLPDGILVRSELPVSHKTSLTTAGVMPLAMLASVAIPAFARVRESSIESVVDHDARWLASAAQQYFLELNETSVELEYDPGTGEVGGPLSAYLDFLSPDYDPFPGSLSPTGNFVLGHPDLPFDREYSAEGQYVGPASAY